MIARELLVRPCVDPNCSVTPTTCLLDSHHFRWRNGGVPRNLVAEINRLAGCGKQRQGCQNYSLPDERRFHQNIPANVVPTDLWPVRVRWPFIMSRPTGRGYSMLFIEPAVRW